MTSDCLLTISQIRYVDTFRGSSPNPSQTEALDGTEKGEYLLMEKCTKNVHEQLYKSEVDR
jgi:hypothetical protein